MIKQLLKPNYEEAQSFLDALDPKGTFTFQTFSDDKKKHAPELIKVIHGNLSSCEQQLTTLNQQGAGIFVTINETDLNGRKEENIIRVRSTFVDLDGAPLDPVLEHHLEPHIIVESSLNRWHAYWLCNIHLSDFTNVQKSIGTQFNGDHSITDLPRVMRLPGFFHQKDPGREPFMTRIESIMEGSQLTPYYSQEILQAFPIISNNNTSRPGNSPELNSYQYSTPNDDKLIELLSYLNPEEREEWIAVAHSLKSIGDSKKDIFAEWSRGGFTNKTPNNYIDDNDVIKVWDSLTPTRTNVGALINRAISKGYQREHCSRGPRPLLSNSHVHCAIYLVNKHSTQESELIFDEGSFWHFREKFWARVKDHELRGWVHYLDGKGYGDGKNRIKVSKSFIDGVISEMATVITQEQFFNDAPIGANLSNGFVRLNDKGVLRLEDHSPDHKQRAYIECDWQPESSTEFSGYTKILFDGCFGQTNTELKQLILDIIGTALLGTSTRIHSPTGFIFFGATASNGKSTILKVIRGLLPDYATCSIPPADLDKEQSLATLVGRLANLSDELSAMRAIASDKMKAVITGDVVSAKIIYKPVFSFTPRAIHIFAANMLPAFKGGIDAGVERRMQVIPFDQQIPKSGRITDIDKRIITLESSHLVSAAIKAGAHVFKSGQYKIPLACTHATETWFREADPIREWYEDGALDKHVRDKPVLIKELYRRFKEDMMEYFDQGYIPSKRRFFSQMAALIKTDPTWQKTRQNQGDVIYKASLV